MTEYQKHPQRGKERENKSNRHHKKVQVAATRSRAPCSIRKKPVKIQSTQSLLYVCVYLQKY